MERVSIIRSKGVLAGIALLLAASLIYLAVTGGDRRAVDIAVFFACLIGILAIESGRRDGRMKPSVRTRIAQAALLITLCAFAWGAVGTWGYHRALRASRAGDAAESLSALEGVAAAREAPGVRIVIPGCLDAWLGTSGLVWAGESNVSFGVAYSLERLGRTDAALPWYERSLAARERTGVGVVPEDTIAAIDRLRVGQ